MRTCPTVGYAVKMLIDLLALQRNLDMILGELKEKILNRYIV